MLKMKMAILKFEMPDKCADCLLAIYESGWEYSKLSCLVTGNLLAIEGELSLKRDKECPLRQEQ